MKICEQCGEQFARNPVMAKAQFERQRFCSKACGGAYRTAHRPTCSVHGCDRLHHVHGFCEMHFVRSRKHGHVADPVVPTAEERFWKSVTAVSPDDCWEWMGRRNNHGYGVISIKNRSVFTHRFSYRMATGEDIDGWVIRHRCDNPPCVNPAHLIRGTQAENMADAKERGRFNCAGLELGRTARSARQSERSA